jgi:hypothetical protein
LIRDRKSPIKGASSSSYDDDVSINVYLTAAATIARFLDVDFNISYQPKINETSKPGEGNATYL